MAQHQLVHIVHRKRAHGRTVVVAITHDQAAIGALHHDQVDAIGQARALFGLQLLQQRLGFGQLAVAVVAHQA